MSSLNSSRESSNHGELEEDAEAEQTELTNSEQSSSQKGGPSEEKQAIKIDPLNNTEPIETESLAH